MQGPAILCGPTLPSGVQSEGGQPQRGKHSPFLGEATQQQPAGKTILGG